MVYTLLIQWLFVISKFGLVAMERLKAAIAADCRKFRLWRRQCRQWPVLDVIVCFEADMPEPFDPAASVKLWDCVLQFLGQLFGHAIKISNSQVWASMGHAEYRPWRILFSKAAAAFDSRFANQ